jgi:hypothetical protein
MRTPRALTDETVLAALALAGVLTADQHDEHTIRVTANVEAPNAVRAAVTLINDVRTATPAKPVMAARDLVNITDIADRVGVTREAVRHWAGGKRRVGEFPRPLDAPGGQKIWEWASVHSWVRLNLGLWDGLTYPNHGELGAIDAFIQHCVEAPDAAVKAVARNWSLVKTRDDGPATLPAARRVRRPSRVGGWEAAVAR